MHDRTTPRLELPTGTVTFLRTDVEGSMGLARELGASWDEVNEAHLDVLRTAVTGRGGVCVRTEGDALFAAFQEAAAGVNAAVDAQRALDGYDWPADATVRVRMGLHSGEAHLAGDDYGGFDVNRAARIAAVGHGGQIVLSGPTRALIESSLPAGVGVRSLGRVTLKDVPLPEHLFQLDVPGLRTDFPPLRVAGAAVGNLPVRLTSFIGREQELLELGALLDETRLVTLTGTGGIGKTSLAVELARERAAELPDGAWFVGLDAIDDPAQVGPAIARTLGLFDGTSGQAVDALPGFIAERSLLLILDNFEHVLEAAPIVGTLMRQSPDSRFVVASRSPLHLSGEHEYQVRPLLIGASDGRGPVATSDRETAAVTLFVERARAVRPSWDPGSDHGVVAEICALLDGLPLGIELAAARMSLLPATAIRDRLAARLPLPGSGPRDAPTRQRTLAGTIAWSHELLGLEERHLLHDLAAFQDGFDLEQVERVVCHDDADRVESDVLERMISLADQSLIVRDVTSTGVDVLPLASGIRFTMLRTVQGFAAERLAASGHEAEVRRRHAETYLDLARAAASRLQGSAQPIWLDRLGLDDGNIRAALDWSTSTGETELALGLVGALWRYWLLDGRLHEGSGWTERALAMPGAEAPTPGRLQAIAAAGSIAYWQGRMQDCQRLYEEERDLAARLDDPVMAADASFNLAAAYVINGDIEGGRAAGIDAHRRFGALGDERGVNRMEWGFANLTHITDGPAAALPHLQPLLQKAIDLDDAQYVTVIEGSMAWVLYSLGDVARATDRAMRSIAGTYSMRDLASTTVSLPVGALVAIAAGRPGDAVALMGAFDALCERYGVLPPVPLRELIDLADPMAEASAILTPEQVDEHTRHGRRMTIAEAVAMALEAGAQVAPRQ